MKVTADPEPVAPTSKRWLVYSLIGLLLVTAAFLSARPAYRKFKRWRSGQLAGEAARRLEKNETATAREKAQAALLLWPNNPAALRAMAQALNRETNAAALQFWAQLVQTGAADLKDRQTFIAQGLRAGAAESAGRELQKLLHESPEDAVNLWLASQFFALINNRTQAVEYAAFAALRDPTNRQYKLFLSSLQFDAPEAAQRSAARSNVWARAQSDDPLGLEALVFLAQRRDLTPDEKREAARRLEQHPAHDISHELLAITLRLTLEPGRRAAILAEAVEKYRSAAPEIRVRFAVWLNQNGAAESTLVALPLADALKRKDLFLPYVDAMAALGKWVELRNIFETQQSPMETAYLEAFRARCDLALKNDSLAALHWRAALRAAERNPEQLYWLALYAEKSGDRDTAKKSLRSLIGCTANPLLAFRELGRITEQTGTTEELRDLLVEMAARWPRDAALQNDAAYLNLLLGAELASSWQTAQKLVEQSPENLPFRTTLALALLRQRDVAAALKVYGQFPYQWADALPRQRAVYAAVLAANGQAAAARKILAGLTVASLRKEEAALVAALLK